MRSRPAARSRSRRRPEKRQEDQRREASRERKSGKDHHAHSPEATSKAEVDKRHEDFAKFAHRENAEVPELSATAYSILVQSIYVKHNAKKLQDMGQLLTKYRGKERDLFLDVCMKYSVNPAKLYASYKELASTEGPGRLSRFRIAAPASYRSAQAERAQTAKVNRWSRHCRSLSSSHKKRR